MDENVPASGSVPNTSVTPPPVPQFCPRCHLPAPAGVYYCPNCGAKMNEPPLSISLFTQIWIYAMSVLLPPLGMWPGIKYFKSIDPKAKQIGTIAIVLTVLSTTITIWLTFDFLNIYLSSITQLSNGLY